MPTSRNTSSPSASVVSMPERVRKDRVRSGQKQGVTEMTLDAAAATRVSPQEAFCALYTAHYGQVLAFTRRRTDEATARDVTAETFLVAWRRLEVALERGLPWLYTTAAMVLRNHHRAQHRAQAVHDRIAQLPLTDREDHAEAHADRDALLRAVRFLQPLVTAVHEHCHVVEVAGPVDHRTLGHGGARPGWSTGAWAHPGSASQLAALGLPTPEPADRTRLFVAGRPLWAVGAGPRHVHLHFTDLCESATSTGDLLELTERYPTLVLAGVPRLSTTTEAARRRFADLIDVAWDHDTRLVVLAAGPPEDVVDAPVTDAQRMTSRLHLLERP